MPPKSLPLGLLSRVLLLNLLAIAATVLISAPFEKVYRQFEDGGFITYFSTIQLIMVAYYARKIFRLRADTTGGPSPWKSPIAIWGIISLGFGLLALDELLMIHEFFDSVIHKLWIARETGWSDRIDDLIVGLYGLVAIGICVAYRRELTRYRVALPYLVGGFLLLFAMVGVDAATNRDDLLMLFFSPDTAEQIMGWIFVPEESLKLFSEGCFIVAIRICKDRAEKLAAWQAVFSTEREPQPATSQLLR